jgi:hypothetical protein
LNCHQIIFDLNFNAVLTSVEQNSLPQIRGQTKRLAI